MSWQATNAVVEHSKQRGSSFVVLLMVANHAHSDGTGAYPSVETLARESRLSETQVHVHVRKLRKAGELAVEEGAGPKGTNLYSVVLPGLKVQSTTSPIRGSAETRRGAGSTRQTAPEPSGTRAGMDTISESEDQELGLLRKKEGDRDRILAAAERVRKALTLPDEIEEREREAVAKNRRPHPTQFNYVEVACLERLQELDPAWNAVAWSVMQRLLGQFGHEVLTPALQDCWESRAQPKSPVPYLIKVCEGIRRKRLDAGGGLTQGSLPSESSVGVGREQPITAERMAVPVLTDSLAESPGETAARLGKEERTESTGTPPTHLPPARAVASFNRRYNWRMVEDGGEL